jgi:hypothetical protein
MSTNTWFETVAEPYASPTSGRSMLVFRPRSWRL